MTLDATGFTIQSYAEIRDEIVDDLRTALGSDLNTSEESVIGQIVSVFANREANLQELSRAVWASQYPASASGASLDNVGDLTGAVRLQALPSTFKATNTPANALTLNLNAGITVPAGSIVRVPDGPRFITLADATNSGGSPADVDVDAESEDEGVIVANANTVTEIVTPVAGWNSVNNDLDASPGRVQETDAEFRVRRAVLLRLQGKGNVDAIRADVLDVADVTACFVFENTTLVTDGDGVPGKAIEVVVQGGDNDDIAQAIWLSKAAGTETYGSTTVAVIDSQGFSHDVKFSRPTEKTIYVIANITTDSNYPVDGDTQVKDKIAEYGDALAIGADVIDAAIYPKIFEVSGVVDIVSILIGFTDPPTLAANLTIGSRELAVIDTSNVDVT